MVCPRSLQISKVKIIPNVLAELIIYPENEGRCALHFFVAKKSRAGGRENPGNAQKSKYFYWIMIENYFFGSMIEKYFKNLTWTFCHRRVRLTTDSRQSELGGINNLSELFSIICHNHFQLFFTIIFNYLSELISIICPNYFQSFVRIMCSYLSDLIDFNHFSKSFQLLVKIIQFLLIIEQIKHQ